MFFKKLKYEAVHSKKIYWSNNEGDTTYTLTIVFKVNGYGKRKVKVYGREIPQFGYAAARHGWYHLFVVPWLEGLLTTDDVIYQRHYEGV